MLNKYSYRIIDLMKSSTIFSKLPVTTCDKEFSRRICIRKVYMLLYPGWAQCGERIMDIVQHSAES
jgi:hypothetical protein